ncbi:TKL protein kinase, variant 1 [Capsaspora owczarzaki ATCC 30864]|nr:TKL protein kinase, variant 1 [Capsaspora owczarzaki ATCC 30864]
MNCPITTIGMSAFGANLDALHTLNLAGIRVTKFAAGLFSGLSAVTTLHLGSYEEYATGSELKELVASQFNGMSSLSVLDLSDTKLTSVVANAFHGLPSLTFLYLDRTRITSLTAGMFGGLPPNVVVSIRTSSVKSLPANLFQGAPNSISFKLEASALTTIPANAFSGLSNMTLTFTATPTLTRIEPGAFNGVELSTLRLSNNGLTTLPPGLFQGQTMLSSVYLGQNNFTAFGSTNAPPSTFGNVNNPTVCHSICATCFAAGNDSCCSDNCLYCSSTPLCTVCSTGFTPMNGSCIPLSSASSLAAGYASAASTSAATLASVVSTSLASLRSSAASASAVSASVVSKSLAPIRATASSASAASASIVSSSLAPIRASAASASSASAASDAANNRSPDASASSATGVIGAIVGVLVVVALIVAVVLYRRRRNRAHAISTGKTDTFPMRSTSLGTPSSDIYANSTTDPLYSAVGAAPQPEYASANFSSSRGTDSAYAYVSAPPQRSSTYDNAASPQQGDSHPYEYAGSRIYMSAAKVTQTLRNGLVLGEKLGSGAFGVVLRGLLPRALVPTDAQYLLHDPMQSDLEVAVKTIQADASPQSHNEFIEEARMVSQFNHPNVVRAIATLLEAEPHLCVLELLPYGDLRDVLKKSKKRNIAWTENEFAHTLAQVASGLGYLESIRFVHRDIAARNCLVGHGLTVKISDFGLSRALAQETDYYRMEHKGRLPVKWMAPECLNYRKFTHQSDVWSYGVLAWEAFSYGAVPYGAMNGREVLAYLDDGKRLVRPENCSPHLYAMVQSCWEENPQARPRFAGLAAYFTNLAANQPVRDIGALL